MPYRVIETIAVGPLHIRTWGLLVGLGLVLGSLLTFELARRRRLPVERLQTLTLVVALSGLLGSRIMWALQPDLLAETLRDPLQLLAVWDGGLTFIGGLIGGTAGGVFYVRRAKLPLLRVADVVCPGLGLGLAVGRLGCFLTGLHPGRETALPWGIDYLEAVRHPIPLYESALGLGLMLMALLLLRTVGRPGLAALAVMVAYLVSRSLLDLLRAEEVSGADPRLAFGLTLTQGVALVLVPVGVGLVVTLLRRGRPAAGMNI